MTQRDAVFISYSHRDRELMEELRTHLALLSRRGRLDFWVDSQIGTGDAWLDEIDNGLDRAKVAVMLVSKHFLASEFIMDYEVPYLLDAKKKHGVTLFQVILGRCCYNMADELNQFQAINVPERPLAALDEVSRDEIWVKLTNEIVRALGTETKPPVRWDRRKTEAARSGAPAPGATDLAPFIQKIEIARGDLAFYDADAIVISASHQLNGVNPGMEQRIHEVAGPGLRDYLTEFAPLGYGQVVSSPGFRTHAKQIIHASVPAWRDGLKGEVEMLASAYRKSLELARENGSKSVAFGTLGTGNKLTPIDVAARVAFQAMGEYLAANPTAETKLVLVCNNEASEAAYRAVWQTLTDTAPSKPERNGTRVKVVAGASS